MSDNLVNYKKCAFKIKSIAIDKYKTCKKKHSAEKLC